MGNYQTNKFTIQAIEFSTLISLDLAPFLTVLKKFPPDYQKWVQNKESNNLYKDYFFNQSPCEGC
jgi:hypothetical protein